MKHFSIITTFFIFLFFNSQVHGQRSGDIVVPNALPGILAGALTVVTLSIGEFNLTWMLHTPYLKTLPVGLADSYASMRLEIASAYTLVFFVMIVPLLVAMQLQKNRFLSFVDTVPTSCAASSSVVLPDIYTIFVPIPV